MEIILLLLALAFIWVVVTLGINDAQSNEQVRRKEAEREIKAARAEAAREEEKKQKLLEEEALDRRIRESVAVLSFDIEDGRGKDRGHVIIDVSWTTLDEVDATLHLARTTDLPPAKDAAEVKRRCDHDYFNHYYENPKRMDGEELSYRKNGEPLNCVDVDARDEKKLHYYVWIDIPQSKWVANKTFRMLEHVVRVPEDFEAFADRKVNVHLVKKKLASLQKKPPRARTPAPSQPPPPTIAEIVNAEAQRMVAGLRTMEELDRATSEAIAENAFDAAEEEIFREAVERTLQEKGLL